MQDLLSGPKILVEFGRIPGMAWSALSSDDLLVALSKTNQDSMIFANIVVEAIVTESFREVQFRILFDILLNALSAVAACTLAGQVRSEEGSMKEGLALASLVFLAVVT